MVKESIAIVLGYLLGSIPTAYIVTRMFLGKDIRQLGGGNVGGLNTFREVGAKAAMIVGLVDIGKRAAAVAIAYWPAGLIAAICYASRTGGGDWTHVDALPKV